MDISAQKAIITELELPVAALVYSGKKSLHAIVKIDASTYEEYKNVLIICITCVIKTD